MTKLSTQPLRIMDQVNNSSSIFISTGEQAATAIYGFCFLLGISGNITVVVFLLRHFKRDNFTLQLMLNLASSDILCLLTLPVWMYSFILSWTLGLAFCKFTSFITHSSLYVSVLTVMLLSVQRYVLVLHHLMWFKLGQRGERAVLAGVWVLSSLLAILPATTYSVFEDEDRLQCNQVARSEGEKVGVLLPETVLFYFIPLITLTASYLCLYRKVSDRALTDYKLAPLVTGIIVTFFIFSTPYVVVSVMIMATPSEPFLSLRKFAYRGPRRAVESIFVLNSCANPILYAFNFRALRQSADRNVPQTSSNTQ